MKLRNIILAGALALLAACSPKEKSFDEYPVREGTLEEMSYSPEKTKFALWSPEACEVRVLIYTEGKGGKAEKTIEMKLADDGTWHAEAEGDMAGKFYTFKVRFNGEWLEETPGINALAVGINGQRAAIINMAGTNPEGWTSDKRPAQKDDSDIIIYEMHHRDFSLDSLSGISHKGKYLALTEEGTTTKGGYSTGIDHLKELGVTHVHILPSFDYASVNETKLNEPQYNWGYDPVNYNVPDGSYSTDPFTPSTRIKEFKKMVQALHKAGIRVVLDVVYNHTFNIDNSNFTLTSPGYFYRQKEDGSYANGSGCGNETASQRPMMRKHMIESVKYWAQEYHIDGFRFDLMGIHDIQTMNQIRKALDKIDPTILIYGEGWAAESPQLPFDQLAMKANIMKTPRIAAFSDEMRDGLRGGWRSDKEGAFLIGKPGNEESIKFGLAGAVEHPQIDYDSVNYSKAPWAAQPTQMISYVSCHDDMCLADRLKATMPQAGRQELIRLAKLAETCVLTSQGIPFIFAGDELMRDKHGVHNSYNSPDSVNTIDWRLKADNHDYFEYISRMIKMRRNHPAFHMGSAEKIRKHLEFLPAADDCVITYLLKDNAGGDTWNNIIISLNSNKEPVTIQIPEGRYTIVCRDGQIDEDGLGRIKGSELIVPAQSAIICHD